MPNILRLLDGPENFLARTNIFSVMAPKPPSWRSQKNFSLCQSSGKGGIQLIWVFQWFAFWVWFLYSMFYSIVLMFSLHINLILISLCSLPIYLPITLTGQGWEIFTWEDAYPPMEWGERCLRKENLSFFSDHTSLRVGRWPARTPHILCFVHLSPWHSGRSCRWLGQIRYHKDKHFKKQQLLWCCFTFSLRLHTFLSSFSPPALSQLIYWRHSLSRTYKTVICTNLTMSCNRTLKRSSKRRFPQQPFLALGICFANQAYRFYTGQHQFLGKMGHPLRKAILEMPADKKPWESQMRKA